MLSNGVKSAFTITLSLTPINTFLLIIYTPIQCDLVEWESGKLAAPVRLCLPMEPGIPYAAAFSNYALARQTCAHMRFSLAHSRDF